MSRAYETQRKEEGLAMTAETQPTPGSWTADNFVVNSDESLIANVFAGISADTPYGMDALAKARCHANLIAVAPDLLELARAVVEFAPTGTDPSANDLAAVVRDALVTIAAATDTT